MICKRCGREVNNPVPEVTDPTGVHEIACSEWCAECNLFVMNIIFRERTAYIVDKRSLVDPLKGGVMHAKP